MLVLVPVLLAVVAAAPPAPGRTPNPATASRKAGGDRAEPSRDQRVQELFRAGRELYERGAYAKAGKRFDAAYDLVERWELLWWAATAHRKAGRTERAVTRYGRFAKLEGGESSEEKLRRKKQEADRYLGTLCAELDEPSKTCGEVMNRWRVLWHAARAHDEAGEAGRAIDRYRDLVELDADGPQERALRKKQAESRRRLGALCATPDEGAAACAGALNHWRVLWSAARTDAEAGRRQRAIARCHRFVELEVESGEEGDAYRRRISEAKTLLEELCAEVEQPPEACASYVEDAGKEQAVGAAKQPRPGPTDGGRSGGSDGGAYVPEGGVGTEHAAAIRPSPWSWTSLGVGVAAVGAGLGLYVNAESIRDDIRGAENDAGYVPLEGPDYEDLAPRESTARTRSRAGIATMAIGAAASIGGIIALLSRMEGPSAGEPGSDTVFRVVPVRGGHVVMARDTF